MIAVSAHSVKIMNQAKIATVKSEEKVEQYYTVQPDAIKINGDLATMIAQDHHGQKVLIYLKIANVGQQRQFNRVVRPLLMKVDGTIQPISPATNENQFNSQQYYRNLGVYNCIRGTGKLVGYQTFHGISRLHHFRACLRNYFQTFPAPLSLFSCRLILGLNDVQLSDTIKHVQQLGIVHLFCLSGLHVTVLCGLIQKLFSLLNVTRERTNTIQLMILPVFWIVGGESISLTRAVLMLELGLISQRLGRKQFDTWASGLVIHQIIVPGLLLNLGGQLSYLLSFALCHINWAGSHKRTFDLNVISIPVLLHATYQVHVLTMILNYVMIPVFSWLILPGVLLCAVLGRLLPGMVVIFNRLLCEYQYVLSWLAKCPGLLIFGKIPNWVTLLLVIWSLLYAEQSIPNRLIPFLIVTTYSVVFLMIHLPMRGEVVFFDIGQGDSILIKEPFNRRIMLIDTGGQLLFKRASWQQRAIVSDGAERVTINYLKSKGIRSIDGVFLSHSDADHIGYITTMCREMNIRQIFVPAGMERMAKFTRRIPPQTKVVPVTDQSDLSQFHLQVLHPFKPGRGTNSDSMVLFGRLGNRNFIFTGDLDRAGELQVIHKYHDLHADVIKLGHHGSKTSSEPRFLAQLHPTIGIISAGRHNRYGHPNSETITTLQRQNIAYLSTQRYGMIKYLYTRQSGQFQTTLKGDEFNWMR